MDEILTDYFNAGYTYFEIQVQMSLDHRINISLRQLKRHLKRLGLRRRSVWHPNIVQSAIQAEILNSGANLGCRAMARRLLTRHGISVGRDTVLMHQHILDHDGVESRARRCLVRREYVNKGPNFLIHIDGYDKLKRYGFAIHGAICGFSRRVLWLKVANTNNDPRVIAGYFLQYVEDIAGVPRCIRMDAGTENVKVINMQKALRWYHGDPCAAERSVIVGSSHSNQRIEAWWRQLRRMCIGFWMETFSAMDNEQLFSTADKMDIERLRFCFTPVIQSELDMVRTDWNEHRVRYQNGNVPAGKPDLLFKYPELYGTVDYRFPIEQTDIETFKGFCKYPESRGCSEEIRNLFLNIMAENNMRSPETLSEAKELFQVLKRAQSDL